MKPTIIIAGFPGVGKSTYAKIYKDSIDLESSNFHWIETPAGKFQHPEWPMNYVNAIRILEENLNGNQVKYIFISTHKEVLDILLSYCVPFIVAYPTNKKETLKKFRDRGNSKEFIKKIDESWTEYIDNLKTCGMPAIKVTGSNHLSYYLTGDSNYLQACCMLYPESEVDG